METNPKIKMKTKESSRRKKPIDNRYRVASVSWPNAELKGQAQRRAEELGITLSTYINQLVIKDLKEDGDFIIRKISSVTLSEDKPPIDKETDADGWEK